MAYLRLLCVIAIGCFAPRGLAAPADELPRYRFVPGQHLVYDNTEVASTNSGKFGVERRTELRVVRQNDDGSWRLIVDQRHQRYTERNGERKDYPPRTDSYIVDVTSDGTIATRAEDSFGVIDRVLPQLPRNAKEASDSWRFVAADVRYDCRPAESESGAFRFELVPFSHNQDMAHFSSTHVYTFDPERGLLDQVDSVFRHKERQTRVGREELVEVKTIPPDELAALAADIDVYDTTMRAYDAKIRHVQSECTPSEGRAQLAEALVSLEQMRDSLQSATLRAEVAHAVARHRASVNGYLGRLEQLSSLIKQPAPTWALPDLGGRLHRLEDYRGKVVLLDFWYRNCGWCMRAMPQVQDVARRFEGRPVAVLSMNVDQNEADARYVVDRFQLEYPTLRATRALGQAYGARGYPTLVVLDQNGIVRHLHAGYSGNLSEEMTELIEGMLE